MPAGRRTFLDAGVLIVGARGTESDRERVLAILEEPGRSFLASPFLYLEVVPKATYHKQQAERAFYDRYFKDATWIRDFERMDETARRESEKHGLGAMDALHLAAAYLGNAADLITTERPAKPLYRSGLAEVVCLYEYGHES